MTQLITKLIKFNQHIYVIEFQKVFFVIHINDLKIINNVTYRLFAQNI